MTALLEAANLSARHPGTSHDVVRDLHLSVARGEIVCLAGQHGSGKSTTLAALGRELRPREGSVTFAGTPIWSIPRRTFARKVAHLPQEPLFPPGTTVEPFVQSGRYPHALRGPDRCDRSAVDEALSIRPPHRHPHPRPPLRSRPSRASTPRRNAARRLR